MSDGDGRTKEANTFKTIIPPSDLSVSVLSKANEREVERRSSEVYLEGHLPSDTKCQVYVDGLSGAKCQVLSNSSNEEQTQKDDRNFDRRNDLAPLQFLPDKLSQVYDNQLSPVDPPSPGHHRGSSKHFLPASSFSFNGYEELSAKVNGCCYSKPSKQKSENETKLRHVSFDWPKSERESLLKTCPSLDGSVSLPPDPLSEIQQFGGSDNLPSSATFSDTPASVTVNISRSSFAPSTPASVIASQASLDSGVLSVRSFDLSQNSAFDAAIKRKRTASSVSSGIGELGQTSLDNEGPLPTAVSDASNSIDSCHRSENILSTPILAAKPSGKGDGCKVILDSVAGKHSNKESVSDSSPEQQPIGAQLSAHGKVDHSFVLPETGLDSRNVFPSVIFPVASEESLLSSVTLGEKAAAMERSPFQIVPSESMVKALRSPEVGDLCGKSSLYSPETLKKIEKFALNLVMLVLNEAFSQSVSLGWSIKCSGQCSQELCREDYKKKSLCREIRGREGEKSFFSSLGLSSCSSSLCWTPELPFSPCHRPYSRTSKRSSSLSVSHDSLIGGPAGQDVSHLIKGAVSHDALLAFPVPKERKDEKGTCVVCLDNDVYSLPVDVVKPYQGPILQPKVIIQQPKKKHHQNIRLHLEGDAVVSAPSSKKTHKKKGGKHSTHRGRTIAASNSTESSTSKRVVQSNGEVPQSSDASVCTANTDKSEKNGVKKEKEADKHDTHHQKEIKCYDQSKLCKIIPFSSHKPHKRKEIDSKMDRKKSKSISSNIRNTLVTFFSFRRAHKENGNCINAKNEFIDASSQGFFESSEGVKWGKICPLPSAPPLRTSVKYSAFSDHSGSTNVSGGTKNPTHNHKKENTTATDPTKVNHANSSHSNGSISHHRQSNSISPASLLSCLGHPRTNSINEQEPRTRSRLPVEASKQLLSMPPSSKSSGLGLVTKRALPPLPPSLRKGESHPSSSDSEWKPHTHDKLDEGCDFASIIEKVKNYGWYWGPISGEAAEKVLSNEPDGSFIVRDSSDYHYIFSLTFRLNGVTRHVRIEHDQGNFSFGGFTRFKSQTIVDFIEKAVEHSRSGRYLFFLHRRPVLGPMRVQLLHPVSRFKHVQSLQHLCRFVIVKQVRKDLIHDLPLPQRLKDYLSSPHYYSEQVEQCMSSSNAPSIDGTTASPERRNRSPCFRHNSQQPQVQARFESPVISLPSSSFNFCASRSSRAEASGNGFSLNLRCNFGDLSTSVGPSKRKKTRDSRLSSSHSSLENNSLWPVSPSTLSSESNAGQTGSHSFNAKKASQLLYGSSHSSPSSPVPLDYSPPDWLSSSEDVFQLQTKSVELPPTTAHILCNDGQRRGIKPGGGIGSPADNENQKTNRSEHNCGQSASSVASPSFTNAFVLDDRRRAHDSQKVSEASATEAIKKYDLRLKINFENTYNENQSLLSTTKEN